MKNVRNLRDFVGKCVGRWDSVMIAIRQTSGADFADATFYESILDTGKS